MNIPVIVSIIIRRLNSSWTYTNIQWPGHEKVQNITTKAFEDVTSQSEFLRMTLLGGGSSPGEIGGIGHKVLQLHLDIFTKKGAILRKFELANLAEILFRNYDCGVDSVLFYEPFSEAKGFDPNGFDFIKTVVPMETFAGENSNHADLAFWADRDNWNNPAIWNEM
jgi:hypothetical protein